MFASRAFSSFSGLKDVLPAALSFDRRVSHIHKDSKNMIVLCRVWHRPPNSYDSYELCNDLHTSCTMNSNKLTQFMKMWLHSDYTMITHIYIYTHLIIIYNHMIYKLIMRNCETGVQSRPLRALAARRWSRALVSLPIEAATWPPACTNENTRALCDHLNHLNHLYIECSTS